MKTHKPRILFSLLFLLLWADRNLCWSQSSATIIIGNQEWMAANLNVTRYSDGTPIQEAKTAAQWRSFNAQKIGCYCNYDNEDCYGTMYGKLYNWYAVKRGIAPHCWRMPMKSDFEQLIATVGPAATAKKLKANHSWSNDWNGTNARGFSGFAGGCRNATGTFSYVGREGFWWTADARKASTEIGVFFYLNYDDTFNFDVSEDFGFAVRCVRNTRSIPPSPCP